jgi:hypothetical protein
MMGGMCRAVLIAGAGNGMVDTLPFRLFVIAVLFLWLIALWMRWVRPLSFIIFWMLPLWEL